MQSNRSAAYASLGKYEDSLKDAEKCLEINSKFVKGYSRKGLALYYLKRYPESVKVYQAGLSIEPDNETLKSGMAEAHAYTNSAILKYVPKEIVASSGGKLQSSQLLSSSVIGFYFSAHWYYHL